MSERVAIVGSRDIPFEVILQVMEYVDGLPQDTVVVTGDAEGTDYHAYKRAGDRGMAKKRHEAHWRKLKGRAGPERNGRVIADCDRLVAFWDGVSPGTRDAIMQAKLAGKPVEIRRWTRA